MKKFLAFSKFQFKIFLRDYKATAIGFMVPILSFVIFSNLFGKTAFDVDGNNSIVPYLIPAFVIIIIINAVLLLFGEYFAAYKERGTLLKYKLIGISPSLIRASIFLPVILFQVLSAAILIILGYKTQNIEVPYDNFLNILMGFVIINIFQYTLVMFIQSFVKSSSAYNSIALLLFNFQMFLGGLTFPPEIFPSLLVTITKFTNPIYYGLIMMRGVWVNGESILAFTKEISILLGVSLVLFTISFLKDKSVSE